jgi:hypothetical protein
MVTISISAEALPEPFLPEPSLRDDRGGYALLLNHKTIDGLTAAR